MRVLAPEAFGLTCADDAICVEDAARLAEARGLRDDGLSFVARQVGPLEVPPRVLFCSTRACAETFGDPEVSGLYVWGVKTVLITPAGWSDHILRHELIHHWQAETFGAVAGSRLPRWYIEGMAYVLSEDPRATIPNAGAEADRARFRDWLAAGNDWHVPPAAPRVRQ